MQIHWHEGLFLQAHHLQRSQKGLADAISAERRLSWAYPYGVVEARLNPDDLENMRIRFDRLRAIMPSGVEVNFPAEAELPSIDIKQSFATSGGMLDISLAVPIWFEARANTVESGSATDARAKVLYRVHEVECADENTGENS
ncbi:MAG: type VI secretion system baseplate subunit TssK, partial [Terrimicrobiaceae bacterium]